MRRDMGKSHVGYCLLFAGLLGQGWVVHDYEVFVFID